MTSTIRVAHFLPFSGIGGTEQATLRLTTAVRTQGIDSIAFCMEDAPAVRALFSDAGIDAVTWHSRDPRDGRRSFAYRTAGLAWQLMKRRVRVIHCADTYAVRPQVIMAARLIGAPLVCHVRNRNTSFPPEQLQLLGAVNRFIFVSQASWRDFGLSVPPERGAVVYDGVVVGDVPLGHDALAVLRRDVRAEFEMPPETPLIGMVARVERQKDFTTLARAAQQVLRSFPDAHFLVIGGTDATAEQREFFPEVYRTMAKCGITSHVHFVGFRNDVQRLVRATDISLLTTHWEGLPLVLWEAMAEGIPVVATSVDGIPEAIQDGQTGFLVGHENHQQVADRILTLLGDPTEARRIGEAGRAHARATFDPHRFGADVAQVYRDALGNG